MKKMQFSETGESAFKQVTGAKDKQKSLNFMFAMQSRPSEKKIDH